MAPVNTGAPTLSCVPSSAAMQAVLSVTETSKDHFSVRGLALGLFHKRNTFVRTLVMALTCRFFRGCKGSRCPASIVYNV